MTENLIEYKGEYVSESVLAEKMREERKAVLDDLIAMRGRWIEYRRNTGVEDRWRKATRLYFGADIAKTNEFTETLKNGPSKPKAASSGPTRSRVSINIVRPKVDQAVARICEIMLPVDDSNFGLTATPVADAVAELVGDQRPTLDPRTGQPTGFTADIEAKSISEAAAESVAKHEKVIQDQHAECGYDAQLRLAFEDYCRLGTAVVEGPIPEAQRRVRWQAGTDGVMRKVVEVKVVPVSRRRDCWDVWFSPDCGNDHQRGGGYWSRRMVSRKELRALREQPGYSTADIDAVLKETPTRVNAAARVKTLVTQDSSYELFIWHGEIEPEQYRCCTILDEREEGEEEDEVEFGIVMIVNDKMIGAMPSWIDDGKLPVSVACWRATDDSPYGLGIPDEQEDQQAVVASAWRQLMDHGRFTVGTQFIMRRDGLTPATNPGSYAYEPNRVWLAGKDIDDVRKAMAAVDVPNHLAEYLAVVKAAMEFADTESNMPQLLAGSGGGNAHETLGGMSMLFNNATTTLRHRVRTLDDNITDPQVSGYYDWNMSFHPDPSIKVEAKVVAKGSTVLLEKDIQNQMTINLATILQNPKYAPFIDDEKELDIILRAMKVRPEDVKKDAAAIEESKANPPEAQPDPKIVAAGMNLEAKKMDIADSEQQRQFEADRNNQELAFRRENLAYNSRREDQEFTIAMNDQAIKRDATLIKIDADVMKSREGIIAKQRMQALDIDAQNQRMNAELATKYSMGSGI